MIDFIINFVKHYPIISGLIIVVIVGLVKLIRDFKSVKEEARFLDKFYKLCENAASKVIHHNEDMNDYDKFIAQKAKVSGMLDYNPVFDNYIDELQNGFKNTTRDMSQRTYCLQHGLQTLHEKIIEWENGTFLKNKEKVKKSFWNPFHWLYIGFFSIIDFVFGYLNGKIIHINDSLEKLFKFLTGIACILGAAFEIYTNYNKF